MCDRLCLQVEIYMEKIRDLLDGKKDNLQVKEDKLQGIFVAGVTEKYVQSEKEMLQILQTGVANRAVGQTCILYPTFAPTFSILQSLLFST
ncbi:hypothetical protein KC19_2G200400 [Ceratodon purpureus]|uniref:Kinesin motor domain-containing protein n=1 Tax=Ceratodon purpureus TaxID=3225 RepID=A0A8T0IW16_CERPU|nr:hypothetical protein KC19_2G200400 [Ceratodon purpureus]